MIAEAWGGNVVSRHTVDVTIGGPPHLASAARGKQRPGWLLPRRAALRRADRQGQPSNLRTRPGLEKRSTASRRRPLTIRPTRAFEGQSVCYLQLGTQGMRAPREMYERFLAAQRRAKPSAA
jgi:hypothetical protein